MNNKTPAEIQMELLRKLKEQQASRPAPRPKPSAQPEPPRPLFKVEAPPSKRRRKSSRSSAASLPLSREDWEALKARFGVARPSKAMAHLAAQLLLALPKAALDLDPRMHKELTESLRAWCDSRYIK